VIPCTPGRFFEALQKVHLSSSMAQKFVLNCQKVDDGADDNHHLLGPGQASLRIASGMAKLCGEGTGNFMGSKD